ncbi:hypothetical protein BCR44DRAFT_1464801 [Catenaria anguillulae PL171]|uniref:Uncharacterized protein n=1 Tax=Catenaria anguillulae PL171 TaxID=765915 RepID=A0A1Y2H6U4_9FUNG|nr:hypothetical protein BCR44DRAFT_1464801 [Catenaria anguillulae PL171]
MFDNEVTWVNRNVPRRATNKADCEKQDPGVNVAMIQTLRRMCTAAGRYFMLVAPRGDASVVRSRGRVAEDDWDDNGHGHWDAGAGFSAMNWWPERLRVTQLVVERRALKAACPAAMYTVSPGFKFRLYELFYHSDPKDVPGQSASVAMPELNWRILHE